MDILALVFSFFSGIFAAALGPLMTFVLCGIWGVVGIVGVAANSSFNFLGLFPFGLFFGPHIAFGGGVAALAYASKKGYIQTARDITLPLMGMKKPDVLIVGGIFGVIGHVLNYGFALLLPGKIDTIAAAIVISAILAKLLFETSNIFGTVTEEDKLVGGRFSIFAKCNWVPHMATPPMITTLSIGGGGIAAYAVATMLPDPLVGGLAGPLMFVICAMPLALFYVGLPIPVTHHITIGAGYAVMASGGNLMWGIAFGVIGGYAAEFFARVMLVYGDTHIDPPAASVAFTSLLSLGILPVLNIYTMDAYVIPSIIIVASIIYGYISHKKIEKYESSNKEGLKEAAL